MNATPLTVKAQHHNAKHQEYLRRLAETDAPAFEPVTRPSLVGFNEASACGRHFTGPRPVAAPDPAAVKRTLVYVAEQTDAIRGYDPADGIAAELRERKQTKREVIELIRVTLEASGHELVVRRDEAGHVRFYGIETV